MPGCTAQVLVIRRTCQVHGIFTIGAPCVDSVRANRMLELEANRNIEDHKKRVAARVRTDQNGRCALRQFLTFPECSYGGLPFLLAKASSTSRRESERMSCPVWRAGQHLRGFSLTFIEFAPRPSAWASAQRQSVLSGGIRLDPISVSWYSTRNACVYFPRNQSTKSSPLAFPPGNDLEA
jgi:hypothetical protein